MIYEKIDSISVDVSLVKQYFYDHVMKFEPVFPTPNFGGWTIQSYTGTYTDGWQNGQNCYEKDPITGKITFNLEKYKAMGMVSPLEYKNLTEVGTGCIADLIQQIESKGFHPRRARFSILKANSSSSLHTDGNPESYIVRMHIPIITNKKCYFESEGEREHIPADGSAYLVRVNRMHQVFNESDEDRLHIIMDVWDTKGFSNHHRYTKK